MTPKEYSALFRRFCGVAPPARVFIYGDAALLKDGLIKAFRRPIEGLEDFNLDIFWMNELRGSDAHKKIFDSLLMLPMMGDRRVVVLRNFNQTRPVERSVIDGLSGIRFPETAVLVVEAEALDTSRKEGKKIEELFELVELSTPNEGELLAWVLYFVRRSGKRISPSAAQELIRLAGVSLAAVREEVNKLIDFVRGDVIELSDVRSAVAHSRSAHIFQFANAVAALDFEGATRLAAGLLDFGENPSVLLNWLGRTIYDLLWVRLEPQNIQRRFGRRAFLAKRMLPQARRLKPEALLAALAALHDADMMLKTSADPKTAVVWALGKVQKLLTAG